MSALLLAGAWAACAGQAGAAGVRVLGARDGLPESGVTALAAAGGRLYAATDGRGIFVHDLGTGRTRTVTAKDGLPSDRVRSLAFFAGRMCAGTSDGVACEEGGRWRALPEPPGVRLREAVLSASPDGKELWVCALYLAGGTFVFDGAAWRFVGGKGRGLLNDVSSFAFFSGGVLLGALSGAVYVAGPGDDVEAVSQGFPQANVFAVAERGGTFYAGTNKGLFVRRGTEWAPAGVPREFEGGAVYALMRSGLDLFAGGSKGLLVLDREGRRRILSGSRGFPAGAAYALAAGDGAIYAATDKGVAVLEGWP